MPRAARLVLALLGLGAASCEKPIHTDSESPRGPTSDPAAATLTALHSGAQEMALDGFQFDKPQLAWPFDSGATTRSAYIEILKQNNRLPPEAATRTAEISIANLSDSDPGETAFATLPAPGGGVIVIRKDGTLQTFEDLSRSSSFAPPPPRDPAWLP